MIFGEDASQEMLISNQQSNFQFDKLMQKIFPETFKLLQLQI